MPLPAIGCRILCLSGCLLLLACPSASQHPPEDKQKAKPVYSLDLVNRSVTQQVLTGPAAPEQQKFVEIEITEVINPKNHPLLFEVHYQSDKKEDPVFLGTFSLFPSHNPGRFIVATKGLLRADGNVILSLLEPEGSRKADELRISLEKIRFREE